MQTHQKMSRKGTHKKNPARAGSISQSYLYFTNKQKKSHLDDVQLYTG